MLKRLAATAAVTAAMGGVLLTASPALAGDCDTNGRGHGPGHHHGHGGPGHHGGPGYGYHGGGYGHYPRQVLDNKNTNINRPVVIVNQSQAETGLLGGVVAALL